MQVRHPFTALRALGTAAGLSVAASAFAQSLPELWFRSGSSPQLYVMAQSAPAAFEGTYGVSIRSTAPTDPKLDFGSIIQAASAVPWRGKRIAMRAWIKTEQAESGQMWLRIDGVDGPIFMDNMDKRPIVGTIGWGQYEIVMDVPQEAAYLVYGVLLVGGGQVDVDNVQFDEVPATVALTKKIYKEGQLRLPKDFAYSPPRVVLATPGNLGFED